ncbi:MAG: hypothetical protein JW395_1397 [Nitrospira sp.]|nr:hypothetical protein [Nitrospira sp.]
MRHNGFTCCRGQHGCSETNQSTARNFKFDVLHVSFGFHDRHLPFSPAHQVNGLGSKFFRNINHQNLIRLTFLAVNFLDKHLGLTNGQLISFSSHGLNQYTKVQDTTTKYEEAVCTICFFYPEGKVFFRFFHQAIAQVTAGNKLTITAEER